MKAIVLTQYGSSDVLQLQDVAKPVPQDHEVLIKVHAASVNDWDWCLMRGKPFYIRLFCGLLKPKVQIPGVEISGLIQAIGKNVTQFQVGDAVYGDLSECGFGGFAEYVCAHENALALKPDSMSFVEAAAIPHAAMLAIQGLRDEGQIQPGQNLLINGAGGGVGTWGVQLAKTMGVADVIGVDSSEKADMMRSIGFTQTIDYVQEDFTQTQQRYDLILDTKTNRSILRYIRVLKSEGAYVTVGGATVYLFQTLFWGPILRLFSKKRVCLVSLKPNKDLDYINKLFEAGNLKPVIDGPYSLNEVPEAIQYFGEGKHKGKVVINIS